MSKKFLSLAVMAVALTNMAMAANYTVGGSNGWDQSTDLTTWASSITFFEGDNLIFEYTTNHDVREVSESDFDSCTTSNPLQPPHTGGATVIALTSAGNRYFICGTGGHCIGGMKVEITTLAASSPPPTSTPAVPSPPPSTTPAVPSPPPKHSPRSPASSPPPKASAPLPAPKEVSPPTSVSTPPPGGSSLAPPPSSAAKFDRMGAFASLLLMILLINV